MHFLDIWLPLVGCTISGTIYEEVRQRHLLPKVGLIPVFGGEVLAFVLWLTYWTWLYPAYFTPFRHIATPSVSEYTISLPLTNAISSLSLLVNKRGTDFNVKL